MLNKQRLLLAQDHAYSLLPLKMDTDDARIQIMATGFQESNFETRRQANNGPAVGFFQFERIGIKGVIENPSVTKLVHSLCKEFGIEFSTEAIWNALQSDRYDSFAFCLARLNYWISPRALPPLRNLQKSWDMYVKTWRPGKPHPERWIECYWRAYGAILG